MEMIKLHDTKNEKNSKIGMQLPRIDVTSQYLNMHPLRPKAHSVDRPSGIPWLTREGEL